MTPTQLKRLLGLGYAVGHMPKFGTHVSLYRLQNTAVQFCQINGWFRAVSGVNDLCRAADRITLAQG